MPKRGKCISFDYGRTRRQRSNFAALLFIIAAPNHSTAKTKAIIQIVSAAELIMNYGSFYFAGWSTLNAKALSNLFHALLVSFDHLLDHLSADRTGLAGGQVAVVTLLEIDAHLRGGLHLEAVKRVACLGDNTLAGTLSHLLYTPYFLRLCLRLHPYYFPPARFYNFFEVTMFVKSPAVTLGDIY